MTHELPVCLDRMLILESLRSDERHTGRALNDDLPARGFSLCFEEVTNRAEFREVFEQLAEGCAREGWRPLVHLEIHGSEHGLQLWPSREVVTWDEFSELCRPIAEATDNNFVVVMAVCHGFRSVLAVRIGQVTPFTYLLGPSAMVTSLDTEAAFASFYRVLLNESDFGAAIACLPAPYEVYNCEELFIKAFGRYIREGCMGQGRRGRIGRLLSQARARHPGLPLSTARKVLKRVVRPDKEAFERFRSRFLLADREGNAGRFSVGFAEVIAAVERSVNGRPAGK